MNDADSVDDGSTGAPRRWVQLRSSSCCGALLRRPLAIRWRSIEERLSVLIMVK
jgi:hypothetical protein